MVPVPLGGLWVCMAARTSNPLPPSPLPPYNFTMAKRSDPFTVIVERDEEGYFVANVPELPGCHTQAKSLDVLMKRIVEAITLCLADSPRPPRRTFVGVQQVQVA